MPYELKATRRQKVRYNDDNDDNALTYQLYVDHEKATPTSATITIYRPGSSTAVVSGASMTVSGTLLTYAVDASSSTTDFPIDTGFRGEMSIVSGGTTYERVLTFDVVKTVLELHIGRDQLVDRDDQLVAGEHAGDENFPGLISAARDDLQVLLEAKAFADRRLIEDMILDHGKLATVARYYILEMYFRNKGNDDKANHYERRFNDLWEAFLGSVEYDKDQDGVEDSGETVLVRRSYRM